MICRFYHNLAWKSKAINEKISTNNRRISNSQVVNLKYQKKKKKEKNGPFIDQTKTGSMLEKKITSYCTQNCRRSAHLIEPIFSDF